MREKENTTQDCALEVHFSNEIDKIIRIRLGKTAEYISLFSQDIIFQEMKD